MTDDDRAAQARERVRQAEERLRRIRARREQLGAGAAATPEAASAAAHDAEFARQQAAEAQDRAEQQRENSAAAHDRAAATHEHLAAANLGDVTQHRIRAAWHREHAEADRSEPNEAGQADSWRSAWDSPKPFSCVRVDLDDVTVVVLTGEVDLDTSSEFRSTLYKAIRQGRSRLLIDMSETTFCDSSCLGVLVGAFRRARADLGWVRLVSPARQVAKVLRITYLDHVFPVHETLDEALAQVDIPQEELNARRWHRSRSS
jgi:anti-sigma B factor antagonist